MNYFIITIGNLLLTAAYALIAVPNHIINGGVTSTSLLLSYYLKIDITYISTFLIILLLVLGRIILGKDFFIKSLYSSICYIIFFNFFHYTGIALTISPLLSAILASVLVGIGHFLCLSQNSSTVSYDVIAIYLHKKNKKWNPAWILGLIGILVLLSGANTFGIWSVIYGILFTIIQTEIIYVFTQLKPAKVESEDHLLSQFRN